jgi:hypothetical protein
MDRGGNGLFPSRENRCIKSQQKSPGTVHPVIGKELPGALRQFSRNLAGSSRAQLLISLLEEAEAQLSRIDFPAGSRRRRPDVLEEALRLIAWA